MKPENVLFTTNDRVVLSDFGIARSLDPMEDRLTRTGSSLGTPAYMAPEQFENGEIDHKVDLYSLGVMVYLMLTGRRPYEATSGPGFMNHHLNTPIPVLPDQFREFQPMVTELLTKDPAHRMASATRVIALIDQVLTKRLQD